MTICHTPLSTLWVLKPNLAGVLGFRGRVFSTLKVAPLPAVLPTPHAKARVSQEPREDHIQRQLPGGVCAWHFTPGPSTVHVTKLGLRACMAAILDTGMTGSEPARLNVGLAGDPGSSRTEPAEVKNFREKEEKEGF